MRSIFSFVMLLVASSVFAQPTVRPLLDVSAQAHINDDREYGYRLSIGGQALGRDQNHTERTYLTITVLNKGDGPAHGVTIRYRFFNRLYEYSTEKRYARDHAEKRERDSIRPGLSGTVALGTILSNIHKVGTSGTSECFYRFSTDKFTSSRGSWKAGERYDGFVVECFMGNNLVGRWTGKGGTYIRQAER